MSDATVVPARPRVSVVIPCFNLGAYVDEAVSSVLEQPSEGVEIIIVNDGSTDAFTNAHLHDYRRPRTRVLTTANRGLAAARNLGISAARGDYVCALDADDRLAPGYFEKTVPVLDASPDIAFVSCWLETFGDESWVWKQDRCDLAALLAECTVCTASLVRLSALQAVGGFDEGMPAQGYEDWDLWITLVERGFRGVILPDVLFHYRRRAGSMSSICCWGDVHRQLMQYLLEKHRASYLRHFAEVLQRKEVEALELLRSNADLEQYLDSSLMPEIDRRRDELEFLHAKLAAVAASRPERRDDPAPAPDAAAETAVVELTRMLEEERERTRRLEEAVARTAADVAQYRNSLTWRLTAPARALVSLLQRSSSAR